MSLHFTAAFNLIFHSIFQNLRLFPKNVMSKRSPKLLGYHHGARHDQYVYMNKNNSIHCKSTESRRVIKPFIWFTVL